MKRLLSIISIVILAPLTGVGIAVLSQWAKEAPIYQGDDALLAISATIIALGAALVYLLQKLILWRERARIRKILGDSVRRSPKQPSD